MCEVLIQSGCWEWRWCVRECGDVGVVKAINVGGVVGLEEG